MEGLSNNLLLNFFWLWSKRNKSESVAGGGGLTNYIPQTGMNRERRASKQERSEHLVLVSRKNKSDEKRKNKRGIYGKWIRLSYRN